jgi:chemotaxis protein histidine kinase CheA
MIRMEQQIRRTLHRLWWNRWFHGTAWMIAGVGAFYALLVLVTRSWAWGLPLGVMALILLGVALLGSVVWLTVTRERHAEAAAILDEAAGLRERVSSALYCDGAADPFAQAVVVDAEARAAAVHVGQHVRWRRPAALPYSVLAALVAGLMFLVPVGWLVSPEVKAAEAKEEATERARVVVRKQVDSLLSIAPTSPELDPLKNELEQLKDRAGQMTDPRALKHEALKGIDKLSDAVRDHRKDERFESVREMRKAMRSLKAPSDNTAPTKQLTEAMAKGDFKAAEQEIKKLQEQLATLKAEEDQEMVKQLSAQLNDLAEQLKDAAKNEQLQQKLEEAGMSKEDAQRLLENLAKADLNQVQEQIQQQAQQQGMSQQQMQQLMQQLQQQQSRCQGCQSMAQALSQAAQSAQAGQSGAATAGLQQAADQLSELEQLQQTMNELESMSQQLAQARNQMNNMPNQQGGGGQPQQPGGGMGKQGQGEGGVAPEEVTDVGFQVQRQQVATGRGAITGQFLVDGGQVKGEAETEFVEVVTAAERAATDAVRRDRVPRQYQKAVREYFKNVRRVAGVESAEDESAEGGSTSEGAGEGDSASGSANAESASSGASAGKDDE